MSETIIVGAGLTGCLLAVNLAKRGIKVSIYEKRADMRQTRKEEGRSINLAISNRGLRALDEVGLKEAVLASSVPVKGRLMHDKKGELSQQLYGRNEGEHNYAISRAELNIKLLDALSQYDNVDIYFEHPLNAYHAKKNEVQFKNEKTGELKNIRAEIVFGADGAYSALRKHLTELDHCACDMEVEGHGYKELVIPKENGQVLEDHFLHIWPRKHFMLMSLPNPDGSHTLTLYLDHQGEVSFQSLNTADKIEDFFATEFADIKAHIPQLAEQFLSNPTGHLASAIVENYYYDNKVLLLGDAAHAMVPFLGQGMNAAFEDVRVLMHLFDEASHSWDNVLMQFYQHRKPNTDAIIAMARENYIEMAERVGDEKFLLAKKIEQRLMKTYPDEYISKYVMISYTHVPYVEAKACGDKQSEIVASLLDKAGDVDDISDEDLAAAMKGYMDWRLQTFGER